MKTPFLSVALALLIAAALPSLASAAAESPSSLLQKGIYAEEIERNLDSAIKIYEQIAAESAAKAAVVAQAQYRLAVCYQKQGKKEQAVRMLENILQQFPADAVLHQKTRERLTEMGRPSTGGMTLRNLSLATSRVYSVSRDGRFVAYRPKQTSTVAIHEIQTGKTWTALTLKDYDNLRDVSISPDGRRIAYALGNNRTIYVANIDGTGAREVLKTEPLTAILTSSLEWMPGGEKLIVTISEEKEKAAFTRIIEVETGIVKEVLRRPVMSEGQPYWFSTTPLSSDGRYLAYHSGSGGERRQGISVIDLVSGRESSLVEREVAVVIGWYTDDSKLLFASSRKGTKGLWSIGVSGGKAVGEPKLVKANVGDIRVHRIATDGKIYYSEIDSSHNAFLAAVDFQTGEMLAPQKRATQRYPGAQSGPRWSKDGKKLMFIGRGEHSHFVILSLSSEDTHEYPIDQTYASSIGNWTWSEDGGFVLVQGYRSTTGIYGIHRHDLVSGKTETLVIQRDTPDRDWNSHPQVAPDGSSFYYSRRKFFSKAPFSTDRIVRRNLRSGKEEVVYEPEGHLDIIPYPFELSPDGSRFAVNISNTAGRSDTNFNIIKVVGLTGKIDRELVRTAAGEKIIFLSWSPDGKRLIYTKQLAAKDANGLHQAEIWSISADAGEAVKVNISQTEIEGMRVHPDGRQVAFGAGTRVNVESLWIMEGLLAATPLKSPTNRN